jgi:hypothetical protein
LAPRSPALRSSALRHAVLVASFLALGLWVKLIGFLGVLN